MSNLTKELQSIEINMLKKLGTLLEKNNIEYYLAYGTMLGAVRHNGFIPWDDDVDIYIKGVDYKKFKKILIENNDKEIAFEDYSTNKDYPYVFPKIINKNTTLKERSLEHLDYECGVYIDVFILFPVNDNLIGKIKEKIRYLRYVFIRAYFSQYKNLGLKGKIVKSFSKLFNMQKLQSRLYNNYQKELKNEDNYLDPTIFDRKLRLPIEIFNNSINCKFEDAEFPIPSKYEEYLKIYYNDYMKLPPKDERVSNHDFAKINI